MMNCSFLVNGRTYHPPPRPVVVICIDGCADEYLTTSLAAGRMAHVARMAAKGYRGLARAAIPTFTNVNNAAIVTGLPPSGTGICGNYFLDPRTGKQVMMNSAAYLRCETILAAAARAGRRVAMVTAKDKLRDILAKGMSTGIAFSAEKAGEANRNVHGIGEVESLVGPAPNIYSAEASLYVLRAGVALLRAGLADFFYLSLTDYMQHRYAPEASPSLDFHEAIDRDIGRLIELGAIVAVTADHGMNAKTQADGRPNVLFLQTLLDERFGGGFGVVCPITDPYVRHHGALGSAVTVYGPDGRSVHEAGQWLRTIEGVAEVHDRATAAKILELPADRIGDLFVLAGRDTVIGRTRNDHDLSMLEGPLRSHGGRYEAMVPLLFSEALNHDYAARAAGDVRNFDVFEFACNGVGP